MALFDYRRTIGKEKQEKVVESAYEKEQMAVENVPVKTQSELVAEPVVHAEEPVVSSPVTKPVPVNEPVWLRRVSNEKIRPGDDPTVLLAQVADSASPENVGIICLKKSCVKPAVLANGKLDPGFSDIVISLNGVDLNGPYFRIENGPSGRGAVRRTVTPQYLQSEWSHSEVERVSRLREETPMVESIVTKGDMQYGDSTK